MNYTIQTEPVTKRKYYDVDGVIFNISTIEKCGSRINFSDGNLQKIVFLTLNYHLRKNGETVTDDNGNEITITKYVNMEEYLSVGDKLDRDKKLLYKYKCNDSTGVESLSNLFKEEQKDEIVSNILSGQNIKNIYDSLPDFFKWNPDNTSPIITNLSDEEEMELYSVFPAVYINIYDKDDKYSEDFVEFLKSKATDYAKERADSFLEDFDLEVDKIELTLKDKEEEV